MKKWAMTAAFEIRATFDSTSIVVYQAYSPAIAEPALLAQRFVPPFSRTRMTWIKPSFLWMMERSNWGQKPGQEYILGIRLHRWGWEEALACAELTSPDSRVHSGSDDWRARLDVAPVRVQWDPERSLRGDKLAWRSIQVGLSRHIVSRYVDEWILSIVDMTPTAKKILGYRKSKHWDLAQKALPPERPYEVPTDIRRRLGMA